MSDFEYAGLTALQENVVKTKEHVEGVRSALDTAKQNVFQYATMVSPSVDQLNRVVQFVGNTDSTYTHGYFYTCESNGSGGYQWTEIEFGSIGDFLEETTELPTATASNVGHTYILVAPQTGYKLGGIYQCQSDGETPSTYSWVLISSSNLTAGDGIDIINDKINAKVDDVTTHIDPTTKVIYIDGKYKTIFVGSTSSWNSLTDEQKAQYELVSFNDESDYTGNIDAVPTQNSPNAVSSGGVYTALQDKADKTDVASDIQDIYEVMGRNGAKNLNSYPYQDTTRTTNGITFTDLGDGTIEANGTATADAYFSCHSRAQGEKNDLIIPNGRYILSGCPSGGSTSTYNMMAQRTYNGSVDLLGRDSGDGVLFVANGDDFSVNEVSIQINILIRNGQTVSNLIFKPMLRYAEDTDNTYVPYVPTNRELVSWRVNNKLGAKNLLRYPYADTTKTVNGITFTDNSDGTITVDGTATALTQFIIIPRTSVGNFTLANGTYILNGCPVGGSDSSYRLNWSNSVDSNVGSDYGDGCIVNVTNSQAYYGFFITIANGTTVSNLVFKPMLRLIEDTDDTYAPYARTNRELTIDVAEQQTEINDIVNVYGSKNLLSYPYLETSQTESGITFTDLGDGTIKANGTATADANFICHFRANTDTNNLVLPNGKYILSGCPLGGASSKYLMGANRTLNGAHDLLGVDFGDGVEITLNGDDYSADKVDIGVYIQIKNGTTVNNLIFKPMIRLASVKDNTYVPYAMTNRELTDVIPNDASDSNKLVTSDALATKMGVPTGGVDSSILNDIKATADAVSDYHTFTGHTQASVEGGWFGFKKTVNFWHCIFWSGGGMIFHIIYNNGTYTQKVWDDGAV